MTARHTAPRAYFLALLAIFLLIAPARAGSLAREGGETHDRWYVLRMQDQRAGWLHDRREVKDGRIHTSSTIRIELKRGEQAVGVGVEAEFVETPDGRPISMTLTQRLGSEPTVERFTFDEHSIRVTTSSGGASRTAERPRPEGQWLTPAAAARFVRQRLEAGAKEITLRAIDPTSGVDPVMYTNTVEERTQVEALGKTVPAVKWRVTTDRHPDVSTLEFVDERGVSIRSETSMGGLKVEIILADKELALSELDAPELLVSTLVKPSRVIERPRALKRGEFILRLRDGRLPDLPFGRTQSVALRDERTARVSVDVGGERRLAGHDEPVDAQRRPSLMVTSDDPEVERLAREALRAAGEGEGARAESMRRFVHRHIRKKTLGVGFATAAEVARTGAGDCTEHAVLLAAMLRAAEIPSRVVSGLVYAEEFEGAANVFGYHMWTQAWIDGGWADLDATLPDGVPFDATHIALATSDLDEAQATNSLVALVPLLGTLSIEVQSTEY